MLLWFLTLFIIIVSATGCSIDKNKINNSSIEESSVVSSDETSFVSEDSGDISESTSHESSNISHETSKDVSETSSNDVGQIRYRIIYKNNGGQGTMADTEFKYNEKKSLSACTFIKQGYTFAGWSTSSTGSVVYQDRASVEELTFTGSNTLTLYAVWQPITYTIKYSSNGGTGNMADVRVNYDESKILATCSFTRTGYVFGGWATSPTGTIVYPDKATVKNLASTNNSTITLYAVWQPVNYTVQYNSNGGSGTMSNTSFAYNESKALAANTYVKPGYTFIGWGTTPSGSAVYTDKETVKNIASTNNSTVVLYAIWQPINYVIEFNSNGGTGSMSNVNIAFNETKNLPKCTYTKTGYTFKGWATSSSGSVVYTDMSTVNNLASANNAIITLYAVWQPITYTVKYNSNGGSGTMSNTSFAYNESKALAANTYTRTGYQFQGWATTSSGGVSYNDKAVVKNLSTTSGATVNLYAIWSPITYSVKFNANGGNGSMSNITCTYDASKNLPANTFTRSGYVFIGWATSSGGSVVYTDKASVNNLTSTSGAIINLYAVWQNTSNSYLVNFNSNGGSGSMSTQTFKVDETKALNSNAFTRTGYIFQGWATSASGSVAYADRASVKNITTVGKSITLYAVWKPITYTIKFNANGGRGTMASITCTYDKAINLPACAFGSWEDSKSFHLFTFKGWATSATGSIKYNNKASIKNLTTQNGATINLYAQWGYQPITINVKVIDSNGNPISGANVYIKYFIDYQGTTNSQGNAVFSEYYYYYYPYGIKVSKSGYIPVEWGFSGDMIGYNNCTFYVDKDDENYIRNYTFVLYPEKSGKKAVYYHPNGGTGSTSPTYYSPDQEMITFAQCGFTRPGYRFVGWMYNDFHATYQCMGDLIYNGYRYAAGQTDYIDRSAVNKQGVVNLYAVWAKIDDTYTIKFDANGGTGTMPDMIVDRSQFDGYMYFNGWLKLNTNTKENVRINPTNFSVINIPYATFTRPGYVFDGWEFTRVGLGSQGGGKAIITYQLKLDMYLTDYYINGYNRAMAIQFDMFEAGSVNTFKAIWRKIDNTTDNNQNNFTYEKVLYAVVKDGRIEAWMPDSNINSIYATYGGAQNVLEIIDGYKITSYKGNANTVIVPSMYNGKPIVVIGEEVFKDNKTLYNITLPNTVKLILDKAFYRCNYLKSINIPDGLRLIGTAAFSECTSLRSISLPNSLMEIKDKAFEYSSLADMTLIIDNPNLKLGMYCFRYTKLRNVKLEAAAYVNDTIFYDCGFNSIIIGKNITFFEMIYDNSIGIQAFIAKKMYFRYSYEEWTSKEFHYINLIYNTSGYKNFWAWDERMASEIVYDYNGN